MFEVIVLSGLPGSGKTSLARYLLSVRRPDEPRGLIVSADDYFIGPDGAYRFVHAEVGRAHWQCQRRFEAALDARVPCVIVDNTNTTMSEIKPYAKLAAAYGYKLKVIRLNVDPATCFARQRHDVPPEMFERLVKRFNQRNVDPAWDVQWWPDRSIVDQIGDLA